MPIHGHKKRQYNRDYYRQHRDRWRPGGSETSTTTPRRTGSKDSYVLQPVKKVLVTFRLDEPLVARCHELKERAITLGQGRWKTIGAVYRGLIIRGFESMKDDPIVESSLPYLQLVKQVESMKQPRLEAEGVAHTAKVELTRLLDIEAKDQATQFYSTVMQQACELDPTIWRDWLITELTNAYPDLEKARVSGVRLGKKRTPTKAKAKRKARR